MNESGCDSLSMHSALYGSSLTSILTSPQSCMSPINRSKIKTNPWYRSLQSQQSVTSPEYAEDEFGTPTTNPARSHSTSSDSSAPMDESLSSSSSYAADASNTSTLDSAYRGPALKNFRNEDALAKNINESRSRSARSGCSNIYTEESSSSNMSTLDSAYRVPGLPDKESLYRSEKAGFGSECRNRDSGYLSQDSKCRLLKKESAGRSQEGLDTDDSGTLMEKDWSSPEVEKCDIVPKTASNVEVDEAYSEISSLPSQSPDDETFPAFQKAYQETVETKVESKRTISEICGNLEEKVRRLRFERLLVEEKIKEAREEERIRCEQRVRFQKEMIVHRRQILLRTLQQIRFKLEDQGHRLQDAYNATLGMQLKVRTDHISCHASSDASKNIS